MRAPRPGPAALHHVRGATNVYRVWESATAREREHGALWYRDAHELADSLAAYHGRSLETVAGIIAALSPSVSWERNVNAARELLATGNVARYTGYRSNLDKALLILDGDAPLDVLGGPKVRAFYRLIRDGGNDYDVCIDGHAVNAFDGKRTGIPSARSLGASGYVEVTAAFRAVADRVQRPAYEVQAVTWLAWKRAIHEREA